MNLKSKSLLKISLLSAMGVLSGMNNSMAYEEFIGTLKWVGFNFCPRGHVEAAGQILPISNHSALFSLYGCTYGGDCETTFALPDLRGRVVVGEGDGAGLSNAIMGQRFGSDQQTLTTANLPEHTHTFHVSADSYSDNPAGGVAGEYKGIIALVKPCKVDPDQKVAKGEGKGCKEKDFIVNQAMYYFFDSPENISAQLASNTLSNTGGNQSFDNAAPSSTIKACIALEGLYPSRD